MNCPFNIQTSIQEDLREYPDDPIHFEKAIHWLRDLLDEKKSELEIRIQILGELGQLERVQGLYAESEIHLREAVQLSQQTSKKQEAFTNQIRLATCLHWQSRFFEADSLFTACIRAAEGDSDLRSFIDFAYQHAGKSKFDQKLYSPALAYFEKALEIRIAKHKHSLIESSELAVRITTERLKP